MRIIMMALGGIVILLQLILTLSERFGCSKPVEARMVDLVKHRPGIGSVKQPVLRYSVDGHRYEIEARIHAKGWKKEGTHSILVNPKHPTKIWHRSKWWDCLKVVVLGGICIGLGWIDI